MYSKEVSIVGKNTRVLKPSKTFTPADYVPYEVCTLPAEVKKLYVRVIFLSIVSAASTVCNSFAGANDHDKKQ